MGHSRADVVATAVRVLDAHGLENCSMRRVAAELNVQPSALYYHVPNKQQLLALMSEHILAHGGIALAATPTHPPETEPHAHVRHLTKQLRTALLSVRDGAEVVATATAHQMGESALEQEYVRHLGEDVARTLLLYVFGHAQATQMRLQGQHFGILPVTRTREQLDAESTRGIEVILAGAAQLAPTRETEDAGAPHHG